jgi:radical SAM protein with 4Fe4S-binding SPASM domain
MRDTYKPNLHIVAHKIVFPDDRLETLVDYVKCFYLDYGVNQITFAPLVEIGDIKVREWIILRNHLENALIREGIYINLREFGNYPYRTLHKYCGTNLMFINHQGGFSPCGLHVRSGNSFGNLLTESLEDIAQHEPFQQFHRYWSMKDYSAPLPAHCDDCYLLKGHYHRYTLNEGHKAGITFVEKYNPELLKCVPAINPARHERFIPLHAVNGYHHSVK